MKASKKLVELIRNPKQGTQPYDTQAEVVRVDGKTAWVHIEGGVDETPVAMTVNASVGDTVQVRVTNSGAFLVGNGTAPPTDDAVANSARKTALTANKNAAAALEESSIARMAAESAVADAKRAADAATEAETSASNAETSASQAATSASNAASSASSAQTSASNAEVSATSAQNSASSAGQNASRAQAASEAAQQAALATITTDTLHYLATPLASGVTRDTAGWTTTVQTMTATDKYLWTYHTYTSANGDTTDTDPVITGTYGQDGTSVTILGSYSTVTELEQAHPTGQTGDAYIVAGDLYVWNGSAWENVGQIQGPQGPQGPQGETGQRGATGTRGSMTLKVNTVPTSREDEVSGFHSFYRISRSAVKEQSGVLPIVGDIIQNSYYHYGVGAVNSTYAYLGPRTSIRGAEGAQGSAGADGDDGVSVTSVQPQYYLSTSASSATGGSWSNSLSYVVGKYIWTRDMIAYSNGTSAPSTEIYNEALTQSCKDAAEALGLIQEQQEYFWHDSLGAHVLGANNGYRNDITSTGMKIVNVNTETVLASFGTETVIKTSDGTELAHFGYDEGQTQSGTAIAPYYTLGGRRTTATLYDSSSTYSVSDMCIYDGKIYVCVNAITTPESWNANHWSYYIGNYSMAEGYNSTASGYASHAEGRYSTASSGYSHAEGYNSTASGGYSHAEGGNSTASGGGAHAEGYKTIASGSYSHAEGSDSTANGDYSHAEGYKTITSGLYSHSQNFNTIAQRRSQTALGEYNIADTGGTYGTTRGDYAVIIGNGTSVARSNALTVDWQGNVDIASGASYKVGGTAITDYVVEQGTSGIWTYRKWASGIAECWGIGSSTSTHYATVFGGYAYYTSFDLPPIFNSTPIVTYSCNGGGAFNVTGTQTPSTTSTVVNVYSVSNTSGEKTLSWRMHVIGTWK